MNVLDVMPTAEEIPEKITLDECVRLVGMRYERFVALSQIEVNRGGFVQPQASLSTPAGQEMMRILMQRTLEEIGESFESTDPVHRKEEVIDAFNFLWAGYLLDPSLFTVVSLSYLLKQAIQDTTGLGFRGWANHPLTYEDLGQLMYRLATQVGDFLRNRPWHQNAQDPYFAGQEIMRRIWFPTMVTLLQVFSSPQEFWAYFIAKDRVLKFRIETHY